TNIDLSSLQKASETLSGEIRLDRLIKNLIRITIENAGAERGVLLLSSENQLFIEGEGKAQEASVEVTQSKPLEKAQNIAVNLIRYVERTRQIVVLNDAAAEGEFQDDHYINSQQCKSLLILPLIHKQNLSGILYLENNLVKGAFTEERVRMLHMLSSQIAVSIENGRLYAHLQKANEQLEEYSRTLEKKVGERTRALQKKSDELQKNKENLEKTLYNLEQTQAQLVHSEKMASLGELTAGIAHEIKNPLNFISNFSEISLDFIDELREMVAKMTNKADNELITESNGLFDDLHRNISKISQHSKRADSIIHSMMLHSRGSSGQKEPTDINNLLRESMNLVYHSMRAQHLDFNMDFHETLDENLPKIQAAPQDISRVFLNILNNGSYAAYNKFIMESRDLQPQIWISSSMDRDYVEIRIKDNGPGIPEENRERIFNPFFTTKPTGQGTGLGLSLSYDIVVKQHNGEMTFESRVGEHTEFIIRLPK
ncbi:MAG: GAF domain-containing protein, partial [Caldithrix sp.]|nr:GAF domain-containing protein [Caldithrix sp.]